MVLGDQVTGLTINTGTLTTTASTYQCNEGNFEGTTASACGNYTIGSNNLDESLRVYNVGGAADCDNIIQQGDDTAAGVHRGLRSWAGGGPNNCGNNTGRGAFDDTSVLLDNIGTGGNLVLAGANGAYDSRCLNGSLSGGTLFGLGVTDCQRVHFLTFYAVPVPAAAWLFGPAIGLLGLARRRKA
jgi:hypothetical protein